MSKAHVFNLRDKLSIPIKHSLVLILFSFSISPWILQSLLPVLGDGKLCSKYFWNSVFENFSIYSLSISFFLLFKLLIARCPPACIFSSSSFSSSLFLFLNMRTPRFSLACGHITGDYISPLFCHKVWPTGCEQRWFKYLLVHDLKGGPRWPSCFLFCDSNQLKDT